MNAVMENIINRKSIRAFTNEPVAIDVLKEIVRAGTYAPSGMNKQTHQFTVIQDKEIIKKLEKAVEHNLNKENYSMYGSNTIILVSDEKDYSNGCADCSCALENIFLSATSFGIGSVWINQLKTICDCPEVRAILTSLKIPESHMVWGIAALGYPANNPEPKERKSVVNFF